MTIPIAKKLNPIWWLGNDSEQKLSEADWYMPGKPEWLRQISWQFRNPLQNFRAYVIGVKDKQFDTVVVKGNPDPTVIQRNDRGEAGYQVTYLKLNNGVKLPFASYSGKRVVWQIGWQPSSGFFGLKFNLHKAGGYNDYPGEKEAD